MAAVIVAETSRVLSELERKIGSACRRKCEIGGGIVGRIARRQSNPKSQFWHVILNSKSSRAAPTFADPSSFPKMATLTPLLAKKTALITGGSSGIGLAIAKTFASNGASCILMARNPHPLEIAVKELSMPNKHETFPADVKTVKTWELFDDVFVSAHLI